MEKIKFEANVPVTVALKFAAGKEVESQFGDGVQYYYSTCDDRQFYATPALHERIVALNLKPREEFVICKRLEGRTTSWILERPASGCPTPTARPTDDRHRDGQTGQIQNTERMPKLAMDRAIRLFLLTAGRAKQEVEQLLGAPVDSVTQALACTMFIESAHRGHIDWISPDLALSELAGQKIRDLTRKGAASETTAFPDAGDAWRTRGEMKAMFARLREAVGETEYYARLAEFGVEDAGRFKSSDQARQCYALLVGMVRRAA